SGVFEEVVNEGYNLMLHTAVGNDWNAADEKMLLDPRVDGLILVLPSPNSSVIARCHEVQFPAVAVVYTTENRQVCTINADDLHGGFLATQHLIDLGHTCIAHLFGDPKVSTAQPRLQGYLNAMQQAGLSVDPNWVIQAGFDWKDGYAAMQRLLQLPANRRPTAVFAANDLCADGVLRALREYGIRVPEQMSVVGYDDTWFATMTNPPLTSVHMPIYEMGKLAAQVLIALVEGREVRQRQYTLPVHLTVRQSTAPPPQKV
ncbi:MAG: substrate-binding domain-containing protein, partial [bacterium]|nr:substrate-binding domain-containing protein [bacterium]